MTEPDVERAGFPLALTEQFAPYLEARGWETRERPAR